MRKLFAVFALAFLCGATELRTGSPAPPLMLSQLMQAPTGVVGTWEALKGNVVVLEFWATWCGGYQAQIPHLNKLQKRFRNKPVQFLSITDEEPSIVQRFLKNHPISGWIGLDSNEQTFNRYGVIGRPVTVLVDASGVVRGIGSPSDLTKEIIGDLLAGKPIVFSLQATLPAKTQVLPEPLYQVMIRPAGPVAVTGLVPGAMTPVARNRWGTWGVSLRRLLALTYNLPEIHIEAPAWASGGPGQNTYDATVAAPDLTEARRNTLLRQCLEDTFQLRVHRESRQTNVYALRRRPGVKPKLERSHSRSTGGWVESGEFVAVSKSPAAIASVVERALGKAVVDETGLTGTFDFKLKWDGTKPETIIDAVGDQLGLELTPAQRQLEYLVVDSAVQPQAW